jgi:XTP/dITP diphosphohydrolase
MPISKMKGPQSMLHINNVSVKFLLCAILCTGCVERTESSLNDFDYRSYDHSDLKAAGVTPYTVIDGVAYLLLGKQTEEGMRAGFWQGFGGKRDPGESAFENALREFAEESRNSINDRPSPYKEDSHPVEDVFATAHLNCHYYQLMLPITYDPALPKRFEKISGATRFEREKSELRWVKLQSVVDAVYRARVLSLIKKTPPSKLDKEISIPTEKETLLAHNFVDTLVIQLLNPKDGIHNLLSGDSLPSSSFSSDESPNFYQGENFSLNTGNPDKLKEFQKYFEKYGWRLSMTTADLKEIDATPELVAMHKASQMPDYVLVEDTSLDVEGADVGINVKYLIDTLDEHVGSRATWTVFLSFKDHGHVYTFKGDVKGTIVKPQGDVGFGFDPYFLPNGASKTLAENKPEEYNARALAIKALLNGEIHSHGPEITDWAGPWQREKRCNKQQVYRLKAALYSTI